MKPVFRVYLCNEEGEKVFGEGPYRLLCGVRDTGSVRSAAISMGMAYSKAIRILSRAEEAFGYPLTTRTAGGVRGGGSRLTREGAELLEKYERYCKACVQAGEEHYGKIFGA